MLLSDRDIRAEISAGRVKVEPFTEAMVQPSSVDVRLDRFFRVFENHKYSVIDPSIEQAELTREVAVSSDEHFILHPNKSISSIIVTIQLRFIQLIQIPLMIPSLLQFLPIYIVSVLFIPPSTPLFHKIQKHMEPISNKSSSIMKNILNYG